MLVNYSNHPYDNWNEKQKEAAKAYGEVIDLPFPHIPGDADETKINSMAKEAIDQITGFLDNDPKSAVMVQGEFTLTYAVVSALIDRGIRVISACADRCVREGKDMDGNIVKQVEFNFLRFRDYVQLYE